MDEFNWFSKELIGGAFMGASTTFYNIMTAEYSNYELYGSFLITFGLFMLTVWWYPIWKEEKAHG